MSLLKICYTPHGLFFRRKTSNVKERKTRGIQNSEICSFFQKFYAVLFFFVLFWFLRHLTKHFRRLIILFCSFFCSFAPPEISEFCSLEKRDRGACRHYVTEITENCNNFATSEKHLFRRYNQSACTKFSSSLSVSCAGG